jgi:shikimate kinase
VQIILIGYRCTGKSSVGRQLAERLNLPFYDTDKMIVDRIGKTIKALVAEKGWEAFRQEEKKVIREISFLENAVIALGGGAILDPENRGMINGKGWVVWLIAGLDTILKRMLSDPLNTDNRPSLSDKGWQDEIQDTLDQRTPLYQQLADFEVNTEAKSVEAITEEILKGINFIVTAKQG